MKKHYNIYHPCVKECVDIFIDNLERNEFYVTQKNPVSSWRYTIGSKNIWMSALIYTDDSILFRVDSYEFEGQSVSFSNQIKKDENLYCDKLFDMVHSILLLHELK